VEVSQFIGWFPSEMAVRAQPFEDDSSEEVIQEDRKEEMRVLKRQKSRGPAKKKIVPLGYCKVAPLIFKES
jgi:hypothetical protein